VGGARGQAGFWCVSSDMSTGLLSRACPPLCKASRRRGVGAVSAPEPSGSLYRTPSTPPSFVEEFWMA
jgi:hypothetical protein